jgi:hypothetical protein
MHTLHVRHTPPKDGSEINPHDLMLGQEYARFNKKGKYKKFSRLGPKKR